MTTRICQLFGDFLDFILLVAIGNPISMFVFNLCMPGYAFQFVHDSNLFGEMPLKFYTKLARILPWHWAKWWYSREELKEMSAEKQFDYFRKVDFTKETLRALSSDALVLVLNYNYFLLIGDIKDLKMSPELFKAFVRKCIETGDMTTFGTYLQGGTLPKELTKILMDETAAYTLIAGDDTLFCHHVYNYIERCGLNDEMRCDVSDGIGTDGFKKEVAERVNIYDQRVFTCSQRGTKQTDAWLHFCETTKDICTEAQMEMGLDQYYIFHATGHQLDAVAIMHILSHQPDRAMAKMVFEYEPNFGIVNNDVKELVDLTPSLQNLRTAVIANVMNK